MHDSTKVQMGNVPNSCKNIDSKKGAIAAGLAVRLKSDGTLSVAAADGEMIGISCGKDLSNAGHTAIVRSGLEIPVLLTAAFSPTPGTAVHISDTTGKAIASGAGATAINAVYSDLGVKTAVLEDGTEVASGAALIDFVGGV